jgi:hypothetical protein
LALNAKGGESISPKQKDRTTTNLKLHFESISNWYVYFQLVSIFKKNGKTLLKTKRRISFRGSFV